MTLQLRLPPDLEGRLKSAAARQGKPAEEYAVELLDESLRSTGSRTAAVQMLLDWAENDEQISDAESAENEQILRAIDVDRLSNRKLFADRVASDDP